MTRERQQQYSPWQGWDDEVSVLTREIMACRKQTARENPAFSRTMSKLRVQVSQASETITRSLNRINRLAEQDFLLLPQERTLLKWARHFCDRIRSHRQGYETLAMQGVWLNLLQLRLGADGSADEAWQEHVVDTATRLADLRRTRRDLEAACRTEQQRHDDLTTEYKQLEAAFSNREAAATMAARLGPTPASAIANPAQQQLAAIFAQTAPAGEARSTGLIDQLDQKTKTILGTCADTLLRALNPRGPQIGRKKTVRIESKVAQAKVLDQKIEENLTPLALRRKPQMKKLKKAAKS